MVRTQKFDLDTDTTLGGDNASDYIAPSQKAIKEYVDNHSGGGGSTVDGELSTTSENPVQNKVITDALDRKSNISNTVTTNTAQNITGVKSFVGGNKLLLKQDTATSRPGFIITDPNAHEVGSLQYRPNAIGTNAMLNLNSPSNTYLGFRYWGTSSNTYNLLMPLPSNANTKFTAGNYYFPLGFTDGTNTVSTANTGMVDISTFLSNFVSTGSLATTLTDYVRFTDLSTVATTGNFDDLINIPTLKTINNNSIIGSGDITIDSLPSQSGKRGKFLTTSGSSARWENVYDIFWCNTTISLNEVEIALNLNYKLPVFKDNDGNVYVYNSKSLASGSSTYTYIFNNIDPVNNNIKYYTLDAPNIWTAHKSSIGTVTSVNNVSPVNGNVSLTIPTVDQSFDGTSTNAESGVSILGLLQTIYPVGSVYLSTNATCPLASLFGTWTLVSSGKALWTGTGSNGGSTINAGLPNITGYASVNMTTDSTENGALYKNDGSGVSIKNPSWASAKHSPLIHIDASRSSSIYGNSPTVQPPAYVVNVWRRTA